MHIQKDRLSRGLSKEVSLTEKLIILVFSHYGPAVQ
jgi:hypothetical protein